MMAALAGHCGMAHTGSFEPRLALRQLAGERCTVAFPAFETIWLPVLDHPVFATTGLSALRLVLNVGSPERMSSMQARLPHAVQISCLGMTESLGFCCVGSSWRPRWSIRRPGPTWRPARPGSSGAAASPACSPTTVIRRSLRSTSTPRAGSPRATRSSPTSWAGAVSSPDSATSSRSAARTWRPRSSRATSTSTPRSGSCRWSARPTPATARSPAFVQLRPGSSATEQEIIDFCRGRISTFKVPRYVRFVSGLLSGRCRGPGCRSLGATPVRKSTSPGPRREGPRPDHQLGPPSSRAR